MARRVAYQDVEDLVNGRRELKDELPGSNIAELDEAKDCPSCRHLKDDGGGGCEEEALVDRNWSAEDLDDKVSVVPCMHEVSPRAAAPGRHVLNRETSAGLSSAFGTLSGSSALAPNHAAP